MDAAFVGGVVAALVVLFIVYKVVEGRKKKASGTVTGGARPGIKKK